MKVESFEIGIGGEKIMNRFFSGINIEKIILFCHGFPGTNRLVKLRPILAKKGVGFVEINYRGDKLSKGKFSFLGSMRDIREVTKYLHLRYPNIKLRLLGYSCGAFYVMNLIKNNQGMFDKIILLNPLLDAKFLSDSPLMKELWKSATITLKLRKKSFYDKEIKKINMSFNPLKLTYNLKVPIYIIQSQRDEVLPIDVAKIFHSKLGSRSKLIWIPNAKHDLNGNETELVEALCK